MKTNTRKLTEASMLAALCCIATMVIKIPSPLKGYVNLGDAFVLLSGWLLPAHLSFLAAGVGSALADVFLGYASYAPATFVIKGTMAVTAYYFCIAMKNKKTAGLSRLIGAVIAEIIMVLGYFIFEGFLYGFAPSAVNIPFNAVQGIFGIAIGTMLMHFIGKTKFFK